MQSRDERYFSAPGRVEIGGNHTDHQRGRVLTAAVGLEIRAAAKPNGTNFVRLDYGGAGTDEIDLGAPDAHVYEKGTTAALVSGVAEWFKRHGFLIGGFDATISSSIPVGAGLSSSAAFTVLVGNVFKGLFEADISPIGIAHAGQFAENIFFGKPCGLMDQTASSFGGLNIIDFVDPRNPVVTPVQAVIPGYSMCVVDTGGSHADLTPDYASCTREMIAVARHFGKDCLREVSAGDFYSSIGSLRYLGDRAVLRAMHFFWDNDRVLNQAAALESGDLATFFELVIESGRSSLALLQNVFSPADPQQQGLSLALALSGRILDGAGAWRVHGGGFAGTILAFVPDGLKQEYSRQLGSVFGEESCHYLDIRQEGGGEVAKNSE